MTPEVLTELIKNGPTEQLVAALASLTEIQRKKLSTTAINLRKQLIPKDMGPMIHRGRADFLRIKLAILAVGPASETKRIRLWHFVSVWEHKHREVLFRVLRDRKADWLPAWVDQELEEQEIPDWEFIRRLIREGVCPKPQADAYILNLLLRGFSYFEREKPFKDKLLEDPDLLTDEVWRIFELCPTKRTILFGGDISEVGDGDGSNVRAAHSWGFTLHELSREGKLDRRRLLSSSLNGLLRNSEASNTHWFSKFHELLEPTIDERGDLQQTYLQLLSHPVSGVVDLAVDALASLEKAEKLDWSGFLEVVGNVFHLRPKAQPLAVLKFMRRSFKRDKNTAPQLAEILLGGLAHPAAEVQEGIIDFLGAIRDKAPVAIEAGLPGQIEALAPSVQEKARHLLGANAAAAQSPLPASDNLIQAARLVPSPWREQTGIDALLNAIETGGEFAAVSFDPMGVPRLDPEQRIEPIQSLDEFIERLTVAVEAPPDALEFELLLDGLSRHCDQRPDDFQFRLAPLVQRVQKLLPHNPAAFLTIRLFGLRAELFKLILRWCEQESWEPHDERDTIQGSLEVRVGVLNLRIRNRRAAPLIACPTHRRGWIDPAEMARRFAWHHDHGIEPSVHDVVQGLLRLAPDGRARVLAGAGGLHGKFAPAFRYALGGPFEDASLPPTVLIAAGRARAPFAELPELRSVGEALGPDAFHPARYAWKFVPFAEGTKHECARLYVDVEPPVPSHEEARDHLSVLMHTWRRIDGVNRWASTVWPGNLQPFFAAGTLLRLERWILRQRTDYLEPLFDPDMPFTEMAQLLLALALNQAEPEVAGLAVDVLIELIRDGRCVGPELGNVLRSMLASDAIMLNRLGKQLEAVSRASSLHAHVCAEIAQTACAGLAEIPKDLHCLLGPLLEWLILLERGVRAELRPVLEKAQTGKTGTLAKKLLKLPSAPGRRTFLVEALEGRMQRASRWQRCIQK